MQTTHLGHPAYVCAAFMMLRRENEVVRVVVICMEEEKQPRLQFEQASVSGRRAAGCFPVLQPVIRAIFSLQATEGLAA